MLLLPGEEWKLECIKIDMLAINELIKFIFPIKCAMFRTNGDSYSIDTSSLFLFEKMN